MNWFFESAGKQQGPVSEAELDRLIAAGQVTPATLVWREGMTDWQPLGVARPPAPPIPPPMSPEGVPLAEPTAQCASCGRFFPESEIIQIGSRPICAGCKPAVLLGLQQGGELPAGPAFGRTEPAWERRAQLGFFQAAWQTIREVLSNPMAVFAAMKREGGLGGPLWFYVLVSTVGNVASFAYQWIFQVAGLAAAMRTEQQHNPLAELMFTGVGMGAMVILMPLFVALGAFIYGGILHLSLMVCGGARQPFETTFRVHCYAAGAVSILMVVPFCGNFVAAVWGLVATIIGFAKAHEISTGRAVWAVLLPIIVCCAGIIAVLALAGAGGYFAASQAR